MLYPVSAFEGVISMVKLAAWSRVRVPVAGTTAAHPVEAPSVYTRLEL